MKIGIRWTAMLCVLWSTQVYCQEVQQTEKPDLSNPDAISLPPMDPYSLSYVPEKPEGAMEILTAGDCSKHNGSWVPIHNVEISGDYSLGMVGCAVNGKFEGRWTYVEESKMNAVKSLDSVDVKDAYGYVWMQNNGKSGWEAIFTAPKDFVNSLTHYKEDHKDGTSFSWNEMGALSRVETYENDVLNGKYEVYQECLPTELGQYKDGKPSGTWTIYTEPGMISIRRNYDRKATKEELPEGAGDIEAYWTEWFNGEGVRIAEGFSAAESPSDYGTRVGKVQLYSTAGNKWLAIVYDKQGRIDDQPTFELCKRDGQPNAPKPAFLDYDHENLIVKCKNSDSEIYKEIHFYGTGEVWKFVPMHNFSVHGEVKEYHPTGELLAQYKVSYDIPEGSIVYYNRANVPMGPESVIHNGSGDFKSWWHNGNPKEEGRYINGKKDGLWRSWYDMGSIERETTYVNGTIDKVDKHWFSNGVLSSEISYKMGSRNGTVAFYYTDGHPAFKYNYVNGSQRGMNYDYTHAGNTKYETNFKNSGPAEQTRFYTDGKKQSTGKVIAGFGEPLQEGLWTYYLKNGKTWYSAEYNGGYINSDKSRECEKIFGQYEVKPETHEVGCLVCAVNRKSPLAMYQIRENEWEWYNENGQLEKRGSIHMGHLMGNWEYHYPNGMIMLSGSYEIDKKTGVWTGYYENGTKKFTGSYDDGQETGLWTTYYENDNKVSSEGKFNKGKRTDRWVWYYPNGKIREEGNFAEGQETGTWTTYYDNGAKQGSGEFVEGKREGTWTWWRKDGTLWRTANYVKGREK